MSVINKVLIVISFITILTIHNCKPSDYYYGDYLKNGEIYYPGRIDSLDIIPGNQRADLRFIVSTDPKTKTIRLLLRNSLSSNKKILDYPINEGEHGKIKHIELKDLEEATYTISVYSVTANQDSSRTVSKNQFIYGQNYNKTLVNRSHIKLDAGDQKPTVLVFDKESNLPRLGTFFPMQYTEITYTTLQGESNIIQMSPYDSEVTLENIAKPSTIKYRTVYKPVKNSLDFFYTNYNVVEYK